MKPVKILILYIKALKFRHDALKFEKEGENIDFENSNSNDIKAFLSKGTEMIDEMRQNIKELTEENEKLSEQYNKMLEERNSLTDDLSWCKAKFSMLEDESSKYIDLLEEFSQHIGNKPSGSTYKYFRETLDSIGIKEDE